ncbi:MAG: DUF4224 domain-containing protein [Burkholderiales bacterium]|jgi:hypothetical protein|nr:DUF4224 domain-containing protein [Burkholderiales bacterium]
MITTYLTADELAELVDCRPNQYAVMSRWLEIHGWRYERSRLGLPKVSRRYHDQRMGVSETATIPVGNLTHEPNYGAFA